MTEHQKVRKQLDLLLKVDAIGSICFGILCLIVPHRIVIFFSEVDHYSHSTHEILRLYACLRIAVGWILFHVRQVDDGYFRKSVCEGLCICYALQTIAVLRAQLTDRPNWMNWIAILFLISFGSAYGRFRFGKGGELIKIYELPTSGILR